LVRLESLIRSLPPPHPPRHTPHFPPPHTSPGPEGGGRRGRRGVGGAEAGGAGDRGAGVQVRSGLAGRGESSAWRGRGRGGVSRSGGGRAGAFSGGLHELERIDDMAMSMARAQEELATFLVAATALAQVCARVLSSAHVW
jgi:hypothetical protein